MAQSKKRKFLTAGLPFMVMALLGVAFAFVSRTYNNIQVKQEFREEGIMAYEAGDYVTAIESLEKALVRSAPGATSIDRDIRLYLSDSYYLSGQYEEALKEYDILLRNEDGYSTFIEGQKYYVQAAAKYNAKDYEGALADFEALVDQGHLECALQAGVCCQYLERIEDAVAYFTIYADGEQKNAYAATWLAKHYLDNNQLDACGKYIEKAMTSGDHSCDESLLYVQVIYYEKSLDYNQAYNCMKAYAEQFDLTEEQQKEYTFLQTRQTEE